MSHWTRPDGKWITPAQYERLGEFESGLASGYDTGMVGTPEYAGIAYFWAYEYRHYLRDASFAQRRQVHQYMLESGLEVDGESPVHLAIIERVMGVNAEKLSRLKKFGGTR